MTCFLGDIGVLETLRQITSPLKRGGPSSLPARSQRVDAEIEKRATQIQCPGPCSGALDPASFLMARRPTPSRRSTGNPSIPRVWARRNVRIAEPRHFLAGKAPTTVVVRGTVGATTPSRGPLRRGRGQVGASCTQTLPWRITPRRRGECRSSGTRCNRPRGNPRPPSHALVARTVLSPAESFRGPLPPTAPFRSFPDSPVEGRISRTRR